MRTTRSRLRFRSPRCSAGVIFFAAFLALFQARLSAAPQKGNGLFTLYYVYEATGKEPSSGRQVTIVTTKGEKLRVRVSPPVLRRANIEGTVASTDPKDGKRYITNYIKAGLWKDLPDGWEGMGNHSNPLVAYRSVAADQKHHRYGARLFVPRLVGVEIPGWKAPHDGYVWVADSGGGIKGAMRFDLFVGKQEEYEIVMELENQKGKWSVPMEIERLPAAPKGYNPKTDAGLGKILKGVGLLKSDGKADAKAALIAFQKLHPHIPPIEHGKPGGAVTLWYLTQAAIAVSNQKAYEAGSPGS